MSARLLLCAAMLLACTPLHAQDRLDELVSQIREASREAGALNAEREARFLREKNVQARRLAEAQGERDAARKRANAARGQFAAGQKEIADLRAELEEQVGDSADMYTAIGEAARDLRAQLSGNLTRAQFPDRHALLEQIGQGDEVADIGAIQELLLVYLEEAAAAARVSRFEAPVVGGDGLTRDEPVLRVGNFAGMTRSGYLSLPPDAGVLVELPRQPPSGRALAASAMDSAGELAPVLVDPSGGELMRLVAQRPTLMDRVHQGGEVGYVIIAIGVFGALLALWQFAYLVRVGGKVRRQLRDIGDARNDNPLGRVLACFDGDPGEQDPEVLETRLSEAVLRETPKLERFQSLLRMIIAAGPLLGLLGTVVGMIITFQVITEVGAGDPRLMAGGISRAMIATVLGLGIAVPLLFVNSFLMARSRQLTQILDEQAAGLLVRRLEQPPGSAS